MHLFQSIWFDRCNHSKSIHNISFNSDSFKDVIDNENEDDDDDDDKKDKDLDSNKDKDKKGKDKEKTKESDKKKKKSNGKEEKEDEEKESDKKSADDVEEEEENDPAMEIFGHSFVLQKQKINSSNEYIDIDYNFEYPVAHIPLAETLHFIIKHENSGTYLLIMSRYKYIAGTEMLKSRDIRPIETYFECRLFNPYKWI